MELYRNVLSFLIKIILNDYFQDSRCIFIFSENGGFKYSGDLPVVNININGSDVNYDILDKDFGCQGFVINHQNPSRSIIQIERKIRSNKNRFNSRKYLVAPAMQTDENDLMEVFNSTEIRYIVNFLAIVPTKFIFDENWTLSFNNKDYEMDEVFKLVTNKYVGVGNNNNAPEILDLWFASNFSFQMGNNLFPDKIANQQGRILRCATFDYKPYSVTDSSLPMGIGSENSVVHEYAKYHNLTVQYIRDNYEWGEINDDGTGNGILGNVGMGKADIGYGALYSWESAYRFLDFSKPTVRTGITCLVPAPKLAGGWLTPLFPLSAAMWIGTAITYILGSAVTFGISVVLEKQKSIKIFVVQAVPLKNDILKSTLKRMSILFLFSIILSSSYGGGLATIMTIPRYENSIETVSDLVKSGLSWGAQHDAWIYSILNDQNPEYVTLVSRFVATTPEDLARKAKDNSFAFSIERLPSGQYAIGSYVTQDTVKNLRLMRQDLYWEDCIIMLQKSSPLLESLDQFILRVFEAGLILKWEKTAVENHMDLKVQDIVSYYFHTKEKKQKSTVQLKWIHVEGAFAILTAGLTLSAICLLVENIVYRRKARKLVFLH